MAFGIVKWRWEELRPKLQEWSWPGVYRIGSDLRFPAGDETIEVWSAREPTVYAGAAGAVPNQTIERLVHRVRRS
jgi:hypothetical protein